MAHVPVAVAAAAVAGSANARKPPPPLTMPFASGSGSQHARRPSMSSGSSNSDDDSPESPVLSALDSSAALILVHDDDDDEQRNPFDLTDDEEDERDGDEELGSPMFEARRSAVFPPLPPTTVFLYLLAPFLKLGALELPNSRLPLKYGLPAMLLSALAAAFARQIWYMLARYLRKADMTEIVLDTFAKGRGKERRRVVVRFLARLCTGLLSTLISITYLRHSMYTLHPILSKNHHSTLSYLTSTSVVGVAIAYLSYARSLGSKRMLFATWLSVATYIAWWGCTIYGHAHGLLESQPGWIGSGSVWQGLATTAFAFCSSSTLPLYSSIKSTAVPITTAKTPRARSFRFVSFVSVVVAVLLLLSSVIFAAFPNQPATFSRPLSQVIPSNSTASVIVPPSAPSGAALNATNIPVLGSVHALSPLTSSVILPPIDIDMARQILASITVILGVPSTLIATPPIAISALRSVKFNVSRVLTIAFVLLLALVPPRSYPNDADADQSYLRSSALSTVTAGVALVLTLAGTFLLPALLHILTHVFRRPLAIVVAPPTPLVHTPSASVDDNGLAGQPSPRAGPDDLLLRKERALQRRQLKRRIIWDVGVWVLLGASVAGIVLVVGGLAGAW